MYRNRCKKKKYNYMLKYLYFIANILIALVMMFNSVHLIKIAPFFYITNEAYALIIFICAVLHLFVEKKFIKLALTFPYLLHLASLIMYAFDARLYQYVVVIGFLYTASVLITLTSGE